MSKDKQNDTEQLIGATKKRVNVTIAPHVHEKARTQAEKRGINFSGLVTDALLTVIEPTNGPTESSEIQSMIKRLDSLEERIEQNGDSLGHLRDIVEWMAEELGPDGKQVANRIEDELVEADQPLSIPDLTERLLMTPHEIDAGLKHLEKRFAVKRKTSPESDTSVPRWELP